MKQFTDRIQSKFNKIRHSPDPVQCSSLKNGTAPELFLFMNMIPELSFFITWFQLLFVFKHSNFQLIWCTSNWLENAIWL